MRIGGAVTKRQKLTSLVQEYVLIITAALLLGWCGSGLKKPRIGILLPEKYNTPDGMTVDAENDLILSMPNFNDNRDGANKGLDRSSEVCLRCNKIYVSNIDLPYGGNKYDRPDAISVIDLYK